MSTPPEAEDHRREFWRRITDAIAQGLSREVLVIDLRRGVGQQPLVLAGTAPSLPITMGRPSVLDYQPGGGSALAVRLTFPITP